MNRLDLSKVPDYLRRQRWFGGKASPVQSVSLADHLELPATAADAVPILAVVEVHYASGARERYLMPVIAAGDGELKDALTEETVAHVLLDYIREGQTVSSASGSLRAYCVEANDPIVSKLPTRPSFRLLGAEQSNTSIVFGDRVVLKVLRKLEPGTSLELEVGRFLCTQTAFRRTPRLLGAIELEGAAASTFAVLHEFVPNKGDGWSWYLEQLRAGPTRSELFTQAQAIGTLVGEMHRALSSDSLDPTFAPTPILSEDLQRWSSSIIGELGVTLAQATRVVPEAGELRESLLSRAHHLGELQGAGKRIRIHGDLHLGQFLSGPDGWLVYDFEGEPARPIDQRREKHSPLRDLAGLIRSFDYAAAVAELDPTTRVRMVQGLREALLRGYSDATKGLDVAPQSAEVFTAFLDVLILEKALYEVRYELQTRPDWVGIPLDYLAELVKAKP